MDLKTFKATEYYNEGKSLRDYFEDGFVIDEVHNKVYIIEGDITTSDSFIEKYTKELKGDIKK